MNKEKIGGFWHNTELTMSRQIWNWSQFNESLKKRGSLYLWISEDAVEKWKSPKDPHFIGAPQKYSDDAILCKMMLKVVYHMPYRQLLGFVLSIFALMKIALEVESISKSSLIHALPSSVK